MSYITRFAPSPTGDLHIGSVRTALYCWLFAKKHRGKLILRIEDTDLARSTQQSVSVILEGLQWLGLHWDEGPFFQSKRFPRYLEIIEQLLAKDLAYRCYCSKERLDDLRTQQINAKQKPKYDGKCREQKNIIPSANLPHVIRFKNPSEGSVEFDDLVRGKISIANSELDDLILLRTDLTPTYNLTVVVDDLDLKITDVIRGEDHISNTPKQINLFLALNAPIPRYAHIPMILGPDGSRLSKRHGASSVLEYRNLGIIPQALINYLVRLGWSYKDQEIFSIEELIDLFDIRSVHRSAAIFDIDKLLWLNHHYIVNSDPKDLIAPLEEQLALLNIKPVLKNKKELDKIIKIITLQQSRVKTIQQMAIESAYFYKDHLEFSNNLLSILTKIKKNPTIILALKELFSELTKVNDWIAATITFLLNSIIAKYKLKFSDLAVPIRIITTASDKTPAIAQVLELIGKEQTLAKIIYGIDNLILTSST